MPHQILDFEHRGQATRPQSRYIFSARASGEPDSSDGPSLRTDPDQGQCDVALTVHTCWHMLVQPFVSDRNSCRKCEGYIQL